MWSHWIRQRAEVFSTHSVLDLIRVYKWIYIRNDEEKRTRTKNCNLVWLSNSGFNYIISVQFFFISQTIDDPLKNCIDSTLGLGFYQPWFSVWKQVKGSWLLNLGLLGSPHKHPPAHSHSHPYTRKLIDSKFLRERGPTLSFPCSIIHQHLHSINHPTVWVGVELLEGPPGQCTSPPSLAIKHAYTHTHLRTLTHSRNLPLGTILTSTTRSMC